MSDTHLAFSISREQLRDNVLIPKFYDPDIRDAIDQAAGTCYLPSLEEVLAPGPAGSRLGNWLRRENYGTGDIPYVRTSDIVGWRVRSDYKKGVSNKVFRRYSRQQDILPNDILFVAHGTYLVGNVAIVTPLDIPMVLQDHVFRLRVRQEFDPFYILAALSTKFVKRQVRARQFSADVIDKIGERHLGIRVPILKDGAKRKELANATRVIVAEQNEQRKRARDVVRDDLRMLRERPETRLGFSIRRSEIRRAIFIPKYYDPLLEMDLREAEASFGGEWVTLGELKEGGLISVATGVEVGKMAYGTGTFPFIRTSDISDWEVRLDIKHCVSSEVLVRYEKKAEVCDGDVLVVRDGTYLVGSSALVWGIGSRALICGGMYRIRVEKKGVSPFSILAALNLPIVKRQMRAKQFTRDVIDTLGERLLEVRVPGPTSPWSLEAGRSIENLFADKSMLRKKIREIIASIEPLEPEVIHGRPGWSMR